MRPGRRGNMIFETMLFLPFVLLLLVGMVEFGRLTYTYYTLKKTLYTAARYIATQQGVNFCDTTADQTILNAVNFAVTGTQDASGDAQITGLTADELQVSAECVDPSSGAIGDCNMSGCDGAAGSPRPDFVVVTIPNGYSFALRIPYVLLDPVLLKPTIRVPFGGT
jgi:hypothetical protein